MSQAGLHVVTVQSSFLSTFAKQIGTASYFNRRKGSYTSVKLDTQERMEGDSGRHDILASSLESVELWVKSGQKLV